MKKGFLLQHGSESPLGPLKDDRADQSGRGWGSCQLFPSSTQPMLSWESNQQPTVLEDVEEKAVTGTPANPYDNVLNYPVKTRFVPMAALNAYYGKMFPTSMTQSLSMSDFYHAWNDRNPRTHLMRWTCIFCCPLTGELFRSGSWPSGPGELPLALDIPTHQIESFPLQKWLATKKVAMHGAAAWAYDCFNFRNEHECLIAGNQHFHGPNASKYVPREARLGLETPYLKQDGLYSISNEKDESDNCNILLALKDDVLQSIPIELRQHIQAQQAMIRSKVILPDSDCQEELAWHRRPSTNLSKRE